MPARSGLIAHRSWGLDSPRDDPAALCTKEHGDRWHLNSSKGRGAPARVTLSEDNWWALFHCQRCPIKERCLAGHAALSAARRASQIAGAVVWNSKGVATRNYS